VRLRLRIRHKLAAGLILVLIMTGLLSAGAVYGLYSYRRSKNIFEYHHRQQQLLMTLVLAASELNFPSREDLEDQTTRSTVKEEMVKRLERIDAMIENYRTGLQSAVENAFSRDAADKQFAQLDAMKAHVAELTASVTGAPPRATANAPFRLYDWWYAGHDRDVIRRLINALNRLQAAIHTEISDNVEQDYHNFRLSLGIVCSSSVLVLVMLIGLVWLGYEEILHPIRELHRGVTRLAQGEFDSRVRLTSGDEVQELGEAFNDMADRLQGIYKDLNQKVEQRSRQLIRSERLASVGFLAAGVAHEINNPLASIAFCGEALESRLDPLLSHDCEDREVVRNYTRMIQQEAFRCKAITEKLLDFSRVGEAERVETDLVALIRGVLELVQHLGRAKGKNAVFEPADAVFANVNPQEIKQVFLNLVLNALDSIDDRGAVVLTARNEGAWAVVEVKDDGCGMTPDVLENLFEPFFTRSRRGKGTGLGLSISHLIVSQHGGTLEARSAGPMRGSTFTVRLPSPTEPQVARNAA
jgi:signal transduction histidine kinase